jgi:hypothetical protein
MRLPPQGVQGAIAGVAALLVAKALAERASRARVPRKIRFT